jgi:ABC-type transport system substrate-binding protein
VVSERPMSLNPLIDAADPAVVDIGHLLYRSLLKLDNAGYPAPDLASSLVVSASGLTYTIGLPSTLRWSDGTPITAEDVIATARFAVSPQAVDATLSTALRGVKVAGVQSTVTFTLPTPRASFAATLTELPILPLGAMTAQALAAAVAHPTVPMPTSGPYDVKSTEALAVVLQPNPHAATRPRITSYELRLYIAFSDAAAAFAAGDINALLATTPEELSRLLAVTGAQSESMTTPDFVDMMFNERVPGLADPIVRHSIAIAVNRATVVAGALDGRSGVAQAGPFSQGLPWVGPATPEAVSPAVAQEALQGDGWIRGADGTRHQGSVRLAYTLEVPKIDPLPVVAAEVAKQLTAIGVRVIVDSVPPASFLTGSLASGHFQLAIDAWSPGPDPDVSAFWRSNAEPPRGYNVSGGQVDPFLDSALDMLAESPDRTLRTEAASQVATLLAADVPAVFLYTPRVSLVFRIPAPFAPMPSIGDESARYNDVGSWQLP